MTLVGGDVRHSTCDHRSSEMVLGKLFLSLQKLKQRKQSIPTQTNEMARTARGCAQLLRKCFVSGKVGQDRGYRRVR